MISFSRYLNTNVYHIESIGPSESRCAFVAEYEFPILHINVDQRTIDIQGDRTAVFSRGEAFEIEGSSSGNDGSYTVAADPTFLAGEDPITRITVTATLDPIGLESGSVVKHFSEPTITLERAWNEQRGYFAFFNDASKFNDHGTTIASTLRAKRLSALAWMTAPDHADTVVSRWWNIKDSKENRESGWQYGPFELTFRTHSLDFPENTSITVSPNERRLHLDHSG